MKNLTIFILLSVINSFGQSVQTENDRFLTYEQNENWLAITKSFDKTGQWTAIKQRFFFKENCNTAVDSIQYSPLIVINGVLLNIPNKLTEKKSGEILSILREGSIERIDIIDKPSEEWIFHKPFSGVIILTVEKKAEKKLFKLKLE